MMHSRRLSVLLFCLLASVPAHSDCGSRSAHPEWIFCDDFEAAGPMVGAGRYFEYNDAAGVFAALPGAGREGSRGMRARWEPGQQEAGNLKVSFGRLPGTFSKGTRATENFREIYYRMYLRTQAGWKGDPYKLSRATVIAKADWSQAMIAHLWGDRANHLQLDPVRCVDGASLVKCAGYNDFTHMEWIGAKAGATALFGGGFSDKWTCVEAHVKLNNAGQADGVHEFWLDDKLEARREGLNFVGTYSDYGLNAVFLENYWNSGSPQAQERYFDDFVVSTQRIGCAESAPTGVRLPERGAAPGTADPRAASAAPGRLGRVDGKIIEGAQAQRDGASRAARGFYVKLPDAP